MSLENIASRRNRILLRELVVTDFKLRYQGSVLGYLWSVLKPLFLFAILYIVFDKFLRLGRDIEHFPTLPAELHPPPHLCGPFRTRT